MKESFAATLVVMSLLTPCSAAVAAVTLRFTVQNQIPVPNEMYTRITIQDSGVRQDVSTDKKLLASFIFSEKRKQGLLINHEMRSYSFIPFDRKLLTDYSNYQFQKGEKEFGQWGCHLGTAVRQNMKVNEACLARPGKVGITEMQARKLGNFGIDTPDGPNVIVSRKTFHAGKVASQILLLDVRRVPDLPESEFSVPNGYLEKNIQTKPKK